TESVAIAHLRAFECRGLCLGIQLGRKLANSFDGPSAMRRGYQLFSIKAVPARPGSPNPFDGNGGIHQHAIEVEKNCLLNESLCARHRIVRVAAYSSGGVSNVAALCTALAISRMIPKSAYRGRTSVRTA